MMSKSVPVIAIFSNHHDAHFSDRSFDMYHMGKISSSGEVIHTESSRRLPFEKTGVLVNSKRGESSNR